MTASSLGITTSMSTGPGVANASFIVATRSFAFSMRKPCAPYASASFTNFGTEFLDVHLDRAVAADHHYLLVGRGEGGADSRGQSVAHRAQSTRRQPRARMLEREHLRHPHLMLANVSGYYAVALRDVVQLGDHVERRDALATMVVLVERLVLLPLEDLLMPFSPIGAALRDTLAALDLSQHVGEDRLDVADDRNVDLYVFRNRRRVDVDVNDRFGLGREFGNLAGDAIVEARADCDQAIGVADRRVGPVRTVHPEHPEPQ